MSSGYAASPADGAVLKSTPSLLPEELAVLLTSIFDEHDLSEIAIVPYQVPSPIDPNPYEPFVLFPSEPSPTSPDSPSSTYQLAIPQKPLYKIYSFACGRFQHLSRITKVEKTDNSTSELFETTRLLLLQNPEHATALNDRRRILLSLKAPAKTREDGRYRRRLSEEKRLTELLLGVQQHAKASTLWHHLRWILSELYPPSPSSDPDPDSCPSRASVPPLNGPSANLPLEVLQAQLALALHCSTIYTRNYYAWRHHLWLLSTAVSSLSPQDTAGVLASERKTIEEFLTRNPRDHTAANYLGVVVRAQTSPGRDEDVAGAWTFAQDLLDRFPAVETPWLLTRGIFSITQSRSILQYLRARSRALLEEQASRGGQGRAEEGTLARKEQEERQRAALLALRAYLWVGWKAKILPEDVGIDALRAILILGGSDVSPDLWSAFLALTR